jgi:hypothetical protein
MKQVREIVKMAQDYIELYKRDLTPPESGLWASLHHFPVYLRMAPTRHRLAKKIRELKVRVREVGDGERRLRYDVMLPKASPKTKPKPVAKDSSVEGKRGDFLRALEEEGGTGTHSLAFNRAISMLPCDLGRDGSAARSTLEINGTGDLMRRCCNGGGAAVLFIM